MTRTVLVVEDDFDIRNSLAEILLHEGYTVHTASNGVEAMQLLAHIDTPCVILLDLLMPVKNGWDFMKETRGIHKFASIPVVAVTAAREVGTEVSVNNVMKKPIDLDLFLRV